MKTIGITGGIGAGKSQVLSYIKERYCCRIILADEVAHLVKEPGQPCYQALVQLLGMEILENDNTIDKKKMAAIIFADKLLLEAVNRIIHPAVKEYITNAIDTEKRENKLDFLFVEAALLIEEGYGRLVDELWYIYAQIPVRRVRLKESRGYSDELIDSILVRQLSDETYRENCQIIIDNSGSLEETYRQIKEKLEGYQ